MSQSFKLQKDRLNRKAEMASFHLLYLTQSVWCFSLGKKAPLFWPRQPLLDPGYIFLLPRAEMYTVQENGHFLETKQTTNNSKERQNGQTDKIELDKEELFFLLLISFFLSFFFLFFFVFVIVDGQHAFFQFVYFCMWC